MVERDIERDIEAEKNRETKSVTDYLFIKILFKKKSQRIHYKKRKN